MSVMVRMAWDHDEAMSRGSPILVHLVLLALFYCSVQGYYEGFGPGNCPPQPRNAWVSVNATRVFFIGAHHTGTTSIVWLVNHVLIPRCRLPLKGAKHDMFWPARVERLWTAASFADTPYLTGQWTERLEFGHARHPDVRTLFHCFPRSLFVINTRSLASYVRAKVEWESGRRLAEVCTMTPIEHDLAVPTTETGRLLRRVTERACMMAWERERLHARFLDFVLEDPAAREHRFLAVDMTTESTGQVARRLCRFIATFVFAGDQQRLRAHCGVSGLGHPVPGSHSHQSVLSAKAKACEAAFVSRVLTDPPAALPPCRRIEGLFREPMLEEKVLVGTLWNESHSSSLRDLAMRFENAHRDEEDEERHR